MCDPLLPYTCRWCLPVAVRFDRRIALEHHLQIVHTISLNNDCLPLYYTITVELTLFQLFNVYRDSECHRSDGQSSGP